MNQSKISSSRASLLDRYEIFAEIAAGGMASVHLARMRGPEGFSKIVAVKRMHPHRMSDPSGAVQLLDEARMAARISHPNVVSTLDIVVEEGEVLLVMEYVHGESLARLAGNQQDAPIPIPLAVAMIIDGLHGLHAAHEATTEDGIPMGLVHRDISPQNLIIGADGITKVADFGIAKAILSSDETTQKMVKGKLGYMAPEQVQSLPLSRRTDIFAAAIALWEVLAGRRLFKAETQAATVHRIMAMPIAPPSELRPEVPAELDRVILKALSRDPTRRYQTAREMALALEAAVPPVRASQVGDWVTRRAGASLEARKRLIADIEAGVSSASSGIATRPAQDSQSATFTGVTSTTQTNPISASPSSWDVPEAARSTGPLSTSRGESHLASSSALSMPGTSPAARATSPSLAKPEGHPEARQRERRLRYLGWAAGAVLVLGAYWAWGTLAHEVQPSERDFAGDPLGEAPSNESPDVGTAPLVAPPSSPPVAEVTEPEEVEARKEESEEPPPAAEPRELAPRPRPIVSPKPRRVTQPAQKTKVDCDPPFSIDAQGHRIFKPECM